MAMEALTPKIAMETLTPKIAMETITLVSKGRKQMGDKGDGNYEIVCKGDDEIHPNDEVVGTIRLISNHGVHYVYAVTPKIPMKTLAHNIPLKAVDLAINRRKQMRDSRDGSHCLMDVFQIVYLGDDEIHPEDQVGTIKMISDYGFQYLYNATDVHPYFTPSLKRGDQILVMVNSPTIRCEYHYFEFDLFNHAYKGTLVMDCTIAVSTEPTFWVKRIGQKDGPGSIAVHFGLFPYARVAHIQIICLDADSIESAYGVVSASNSGFPSAASTLFAKDADHTICPYHDLVFPLFKSRVAVPLDTTLYVDFSLNFDGEDFNGRLAFECRKDGVVDLLDPSNKIRVRVTWGGDMDSILSTYNDPREGLGCC